MFKRIKRLYALSKKDPDALAVLESLTSEQLASVPEIVEGDGQVTFLGQGSAEEYQDMLNEDNGTKSWLDRLKAL